MKDEEKMITFWDRLGELLSVHSLSQTEFAKRINVPQTTLSMSAIRDVTPKADFLFKVADYFKVSPRWLLTGCDPESIDAKYAVVIRNKRILEIAYELTNHSQDFLTGLELIMRSEKSQSAKLV